MVQATTAPAHRALLIDGTVSLAGSTGGRVKVRGIGERVEVDIDRSSLSPALVLRLPSRTAQRRRLEAAQLTLRLAGLSIELRVDGYPVGILEGNAKGSLLGRLLGFGPIDIKLYRLLQAWMKRPSKRDDG